MRVDTAPPRFGFFVEHASDERCRPEAGQRLGLGLDARRPFRNRGLDAGEEMVLGLDDDVVHVGQPCDGVAQLGEVGGDQAGFGHGSAFVPSTPWTATANACQSRRFSRTAPLPVEVSA